jgi:hypothetical protein
MSVEPYCLVRDILVHARRFSGAESLLFGPPNPPYPFFDRVSNVEKGLAVAGFYIWRLNEEYKGLVADLPKPPFTFGLRRALAALVELVETRLKGWGWEYVLAADGLKTIGERMEACEKATFDPLLDAARSWQEGKDVERHEGAERLVDIAIDRGIEPTLTPEEGERESLALDMTNGG